MTDSLSEIAQRIFSAADIVLVTHTNPDADAYGSMCGLGLALRTLGKKVSMVNEQGSLERFQFMPGVSEIISNPVPVRADQLLIACDCATAQRVGDSLKGWIESAASVVNIDHHYSNTKFGTVGNLVFEDASSTAEMVYDLIVELDRLAGGKSGLTTDVANNLLTGIMGDTGLFRYENTSAKTFLVAHNLFNKGARSNLIAQELFSKTSLAAVRLQSAALSRMELAYDGRFLRILVPKAMIEEFGAQIEDTDVLVERGRDIMGVEVSALVKEDGDVWRCSLRSKSRAVDVSTVAVKFGGGGHKAAAAFRWRKGLDELLTALNEAVGELLGVK